MCRRAAACQAVLDQASALWPLRDKAADGICASPRHTAGNPGSDHEPHVNGFATAVDLTDDKASGCDADLWAEHLRTTRDPRVKYVICNRRMFSSYATSSCPAWTWRPYTGPNPHEHHTHLSIIPAAIRNTAPWFPAVKPAPTPHPPAATTAPAAKTEENLMAIVFRDPRTRQVFLVEGGKKHHIDRPALTALQAMGATKGEPVESKELADLFPTA
jgi:hypothetical protein